MLENTADVLMQTLVGRNKKCFQLNVIRGIWLGQFEAEHFGYLLFQMFFIRKAVLSSYH